MTNVAVIGCGLIGRRRAQVASEHPNSKLLMVADINQAAAGELAKDYGCRALINWREVIASPEVDAVAVATHNGMLAEITIAALEVGKHVLVEKPMGRNLAEALKMLEAAKTAQRVLKIGFNHRYHSGIAKAYQFVKKALLERSSIFAPDMDMEVALVMRKNGAATPN